MEMKRIAGLISILAIAFVLSSNVSAEEKKGIYAGVSGGYVIPVGVNGILINTAGTYPPYGPDLKDGYLLGAKVGWLTPFTRQIVALELEYNHIYNDFDSAERFILMPPADLDLDSAIHVDLIMLNAIARYPEGRIHPHVGLGLGYAYAKVDEAVVSFAGTPFWTYDGGSDSVFAYQLIAGVDIDITDNIMLSLAYKYIDLQEISYGSRIGIVPPDPLSVEAVEARLDYQSSNFVLSLCYLF